MREFSIGQVEQSTSSGGRMTCLYQILVRDVPPPVCCESYGIRITDKDSGESEEGPDITIFPEDIQVLAQMLLQGGVTPCTLRDVVEDWL